MDVCVMHSLSILLNTCERSILSLVKRKRQRKQAKFWKKPIEPDDILDFIPKLLRVFPQRPDVSVEGLLEGEAEIRKKSGEGRNLPGGPVVVVDDVLIAVLRIERVVLLRTKPEQRVSVVDVDPQRVDGRDHGVDTDVELVAVDCKERKRL